MAVQKCCWESLLELQLEGNHQFCIVNRPSAQGEIICYVCKRVLFAMHPSLAVDLIADPRWQKQFEHVGTPLSVGAYRLLESSLNKLKGG